MSANELFNALPSPLPSQLPNPQACRDIKGDVNNDIEVEVEVKPQKPIFSPAPAVVNFNSNGHYRECERLYTQITGQMAIPSTATTAYADLELILDYYKGDKDRAVKEGKVIFGAWCNTTGKTTGKPYSKTNTGWLGKWLENLAPKPNEISIDPYQAVIDKYKNQEDTK
jgi:hypothetical protein